MIHVKPIMFSTLNQTYAAYAHKIVLVALLTLHAQLVILAIIYRLMDNVLLVAYSNVKHATFKCVIYVCLDIFYILMVPE